MEEKIYYADIEGNLIVGFYCKDIHGENIPAGAIAISEDLWQKLLSYGQAKANIEELAAITAGYNEGEYIYTMDHIEYFEQYQPDPETVYNMEPSQMDLLKEEVEGQKKDILEIKEMLHKLINK